MKKYTEEALTRKTKAVEVGFRNWKIHLNDEEIGRVYKDTRGFYVAENKEGKMIGLSSSKKEARFFLAWRHVGDDAIEWKED